jgi:uncharacterized coiled-coil DUF342 family protein
MAIKNKKKKTDNSKNEAHYFGALLENMDSKIDIMLEGHQVLDKKIVDLDEKFDKKIDGLDEKFESLNEKVDGLNEKFDKKIEDFRKEVNYKFDIVFDELHLIRNDLKEKVGRDEFIFLEKRVAMLEKSKVR